MSALDSELVESIAKSRSKVGPLYPILVDAKGKPIDGDHRTAANPDWETRKLDWVKTEKDRIIARIHANVIRRPIGEAERRADLNTLAKIALDEGTEPGQISKKLVEWLGFSDQYIRSLLDPSFKHPTMTESALKREALKREQGKALDMSGEPQDLTAPIPMEKDSERERLIAQAKKVSNWGGYENAMELAIGILKRWENAWEPEVPDLARGLRGVILVITRFHNDVKNMRES